MSNDPHERELSELEEIEKEIKELDSSNEASTQAPKEKTPPDKVEKKAEDEKIIWSEEPFDDEEYIPEEYK